MWIFRRYGDELLNCAELLITIANRLCRAFESRREMLDGSEKGTRRDSGMQIDVVDTEQRSRKEILLHVAQSDAMRRPLVCRSAF